MGYFVIADFKAGLDTRKSIITATPGSLQKCVNAHITRGGEIEKRKAFVAMYALPAGATFGLAASGNQIYTFGSSASPGAMPPQVNYQRLAHPAGSAMTALLFAENIGGKIYAGAQYADGAVYHFYNGARVTDWDAVATGILGSTFEAVAQRLAALIDADGTCAATSAGAVVTLQAVAPGVDFTLTAATANGTGGVADQVITLATVQANVAAVAGVSASGSFAITGGSAGAGNNLASVTVGGTEILGAVVVFNGSIAQTAIDVANQVNAWCSTHALGFTAVAAGAVVTIKSLTQSAGQNGLVVAATAAGSLAVGSVANMAGGVTPVAAVAKIVTATLSGTVEAADGFTLTLNGKAFATTGLASGMGLSAKTFNSKLYSGARSLLEFCAVNTPTQWGTAQTPQPGAGNVNMSTQDAGSELLVGLGVYQSSLAIFSRHNTQVWQVDPDPAKYSKLQVIPNVGTMAPRSIVNFGDVDTFFLADTGIRSLRVRTGSVTSAASVSDVGTAIDPKVTTDMAALSGGVIQRAVGAIEPIEGRYMLAVGGQVYVFSYFPGSQVSAWSTYEPGFAISDFAVIGTRLYARAGDTVYLYGGLNGQTYDTSQIEVVLPYHDAGKPATHKGFTGLDIGAEGVWDIYAGTDIRNTAYRQIIATVGLGPTYNLLTSPMVGEGSHIGLRLVGRGSGYQRISNLAVHFTDGDDGKAA